MSDLRLPDDDPPPVPPVRPGLEDCCKGSCDTCVFDLYDAAVERYRAELSAWQKRAAGASSSQGAPGNA
jgi:hypothetical protein